MRHYDNGIVVGEEDHPVPFGQWLRSEIDQAKSINKQLDDRIMGWSRPYPKLAQVAAAHARLRALREVQWAYARSTGEQ